MDAEFSLRRKIKEMLTAWVALLFVIIFSFAAGYGYAVLHEMGRTN